jgi:hypothetical protein
MKSVWVPKVGSIGAPGPYCSNLPLGNAHRHELHPNKPHTMTLPYLDQLPPFPRHKYAQLSSLDQVLYA